MCGLIIKQYSLTGNKMELLSKHEGTLLSVVVFSLCKTYWNFIAIVVLVRGVEFI